MTIHSENTEKRWGNLRFCPMYARGGSGQLINTIDLNFDDHFFVVLDSSSCQILSRYIDCCESIQRRSIFTSICGKVVVFDKHGVVQTAAMRRLS